MGSADVHRAVLVAVVLLSLAAPTTAKDDDLTPPPPSPCLVAHRDQKTFAFQADFTERVTAVLEVATAKGVYRATFEGVSVDQRLAGPFGTTFQSAPVKLGNLPGDPIEAFSITGGPLGKTCETRYTIVRAGDQKGLEAALNADHSTSGSPSLVTAVSAAVDSISNCATPFQEARALTHPPVDYPADAKAHGETGTVMIAVTVAADGSVAETHVYQSSGSTRLDRVVFDTARSVTYAPMLFNCKAVPATYLFVADFAIG